MNARALGVVVGGAGILLGVLLSVWVSARVTRPIKRLAAGAREGGVRPAPSAASEGFFGAFGPSRCSSSSGPTTWWRPPSASAARPASRARACASPSSGGGRPPTTRRRARCLQDVFPEAPAARLVRAGADCPSFSFAAPPRPRAALRRRRRCLGGTATGQTAAGGRVCGPARPQGRRLVPARGVRAGRVLVRARGRRRRVPPRKAADPATSPASTSAARVGLRLSGAQASSRAAPARPAGGLHREQAGVPAHPLPRLVCAGRTRAARSACRSRHQACNVGDDRLPPACRRRRSARRPSTATPRRPLRAPRASVPCAADGECAAGRGASPPPRPPADTDGWLRRGLCCGTRSPAGAPEAAARPGSSRRVRAAPPHRSGHPAMRRGFCDGSGTVPTCRVVSDGVSAAGPTPASPGCDVTCQPGCWQ